MKENNDQPNQPKPFKGVIWIFVAFFSVFIAVDIIYITIAEKTWRGIATKDGYQKGLKYNETIKALEKQKNLGWSLEIKYLPKENKSGELQVKLLDKNNLVIRDAKLSAIIKRPTQEGQDFNLDLKFDPKNSSYNSAITFPLLGQWEIEAVATKGDDIFQSVKRIIITK